MKKVIYSILMGLIALFVGCNGDDYEAPFGDFSSLRWTTSQGFESSDYVLALGDYIGFIDVSRNAIEHSWRIPEGTKLLNNDFTENDSIYSEFVVQNGPLSYEEKLMNVQFTEPGIKEVVLRNVFRDSVKESTFVGGQWVVEKTFTVKVFDDIEPAFKVMKGDEEILNVSEVDMPNEADSASWPTVTIEAGEELTYIDMTTIGEPDTRVWTFNNGNIDTNNKESVGVLYNRLGNFTAGSITSKRGSDDAPDGEAVKLIPLNIKVIPSSKPFVISSNLTEDISDMISFKVNGEVGSIAEGEENNFTVNVVNTVAGFNQNIPVSSVAINADDASQIDLTLSAPIYNSDEITITYTTGNIQSVDTRTLESFGPEAVEIFFDNILDSDWAGYEVSDSDFKNAFAAGYNVGNANGDDSDQIYARTESIAASGIASMSFTNVTTNTRLKGTITYANGATGVAGSYRVSIKVFIDPSSTLLAFNTIFKYPSNSDNVTLTWDLMGVAKGQWVELSQEANLTMDMSDEYHIRVRPNTNSGVTGEQIIYFDDNSFALIEPRM